MSYHEQFDNLGNHIAQEQELKLSAIDSFFYGLSVALAFAAYVMWVTAA